MGERFEVLANTLNGKEHFEGHIFGYNYSNDVRHLLGLLFDLHLITDNIKLKNEFTQKTYKLAAPNNHTGELDNFIKFLNGNVEFSTLPKETKVWLTDVATYDPPYYSENAHTILCGLIGIEP